MFAMKKDLANWNKGVDVPTNFKGTTQVISGLSFRFENSFRFKFIGVPNEDDDLLKKKMKQRFEAMEKRGQLGQKSYWSPPTASLSSLWYCGIRRGHRFINFF